MMYVLIIYFSLGLLSLLASGYFFYKARIQHGFEGFTFDFLTSATGLFFFAIFLWPISFFFLKR